MIVLATQLSKLKVYIDIDSTNGTKLSKLSHMHMNEERHDHHEFCLLLFLFTTKLTMS